jgi:hypothetical protein
VFENNNNQQYIDPLPKNGDFNTQYFKEKQIILVLSPHLGVGGHFYLIKYSFLPQMQ